MQNSKSTPENNLLMDEPSIEQALNRMELEMMTLRHIGVKKVKIVHGIGKVEDGNSIRSAVRAELLEEARADKIQGFCPGELFGPFENQGREMVHMEPSFRDDQDWAKSNDKITVVLL